MPNNHGGATKSDIDGKAHRFGGDWTSAKLAVLEKYLAAYSKALKDKPTAKRPFRKAYIDAFAGTVKATNDTIGRYFTDRLREIFPGVAEPGVLRNSSNCPLYLLCFAAANAKGAPIALKIAHDLLKEVR